VGGPGLAFETWVSLFVIPLVLRGFFAQAFASLRLQFPTKILVLDQQFSDHRPQGPILLRQVLPVAGRGNSLDAELAISLSCHDQSPVVNAVFEATV
jgi:hypothetical protein